MSIATNNMILSRLHADVRARLDPCLKRVALPAGQVLTRPGERISMVHFIESGLAALGWGSSCKSPDVALIGREGMVGHSLALGAPTATSATVMRVDGVALAMAEAEFRNLLSLPDFSGAILNYANEVTTQIAECAFANASLPVLGRVARHLLLVSERLASVELAFTHDVIAQALGCRRAGVTISIHILEGDGAIKARRNKITILDRRKLIATVAQAAPELKFDTMIGLAPAQPAARPPQTANGIVIRPAVFSHA